MTEMDELRERLKALKRMRWQAALTADGSDGDPATDRLIRLQSAIVAIEAALAEGAPEPTSAMDLAGYEFAEPERMSNSSQPTGVVLSKLSGAAQERDQTASPDRATRFMRRGVTIRYGNTHPWFAAWDRTVRHGGYRTRWRPGAE